MAPLLRATRPFAEIHRMLSWLAAPLALLSVFAVGNTCSAAEAQQGRGIADRNSRRAAL
jgi:hypothetical protein